MVQAFLHLVKMQRVGSMPVSERIWCRLHDEKHVEGGHSPPEAGRQTGSENQTFSGGQWSPQ